MAGGRAGTTKPSGVDRAERVEEAGVRGRGALRGWSKKERPESAEVSEEDEAIIGGDKSMYKKRVNGGELELEKRRGMRGKVAAAAAFF